MDPWQTPQTQGDKAASRGSPLRPRAACDMAFADEGEKGDAGDEGAPKLEAEGLIMRLALLLARSWRSAVEREGRGLSQRPVQNRPAPAQTAHKPVPGLKSPRIPWWQPSHASQPQVFAPNSKLFAAAPGLLDKKRASWRPRPWQLGQAPEPLHVSQVLGTRLSFSTANKSCHRFSSSSACARTCSWRSSSAFLIAACSTLQAIAMLARRSLS
mmetsp:Transcript_106249/g.307530  ORF Transcript_106249/g.307530 Transcript_106249/m.307530 type:complete len:213 (+) Transcript_106249:257-895(+)